MDTSPSPQLNKPTFGTSDFAVSAVDSREYIDATAEETCPAESVPMPEPDTGPQRTPDAATETPSAASLEVMDQLKALAHNVTQGNRVSASQDDASPVQGSMSDGADASDPGEPQAPEPSISVFPRPTGFENNQGNYRPKSGSRVQRRSNGSRTSPGRTRARRCTLCGQAAGRTGGRHQFLAPPHAGTCRQAAAARRRATTARSARGQATTTCRQAGTGWPKYFETPGAGASPAKDAGSRTIPGSPRSAKAICSAAAPRTGTAATAAATHGVTSHTAAAHTATMTRSVRKRS
jgi:hypothetical protein